MSRLISPVVAAGSLTRSIQPTLKPSDFTLRPWQASDAPAVVAGYSDPAIQRWHARSMTEEEARTWIESWTGRWTQETGAGWAIADHSGVLGQICLRRLSLEEGAGEVAYWVVPAARGRRVAARALCALSAWAFDELGLQRIELNHSTANPASCRVAEKAGYGFEGTKRAAALHTDGWHDMHLHARVSDDPRPEV